jgi:carbamoyl-phosphate synthase large subunit
MKVLVLGAGGAAGVNFSRCAIEAGHKVIGCDTDPVALQAARCQERELVEANRSPDALNVIIEKYGVDFVHAQPDPEVQWLAANQHLLNAQTMLPDRATLFIAADKYRTAQVAGADAPASLPITSETDLAEAIDTLGGDCWLRQRSGAGSAGALPVSDPEIARAWIKHHYRYGVADSEWVLAKLLPGKDLSWTGVFRDGVMMGYAMKERVRGLGAGRSPARVSSTASLQKTIWRLDVEHVCERVIAALPGPANGVLMMDLREDENGYPKLTEINAGRFGTTSLFWHAAGGNLVQIYLEASRGEAMTPLLRVCRVGFAWYRDTDVGPRLVEV